ncbi:hypothetical protein Q4Q54_07825 [Shewanella sp. SP2S2-4]|uniref:hypothetical protein n=1 Tax=Shewanella TaxID=22 RepID=UPI0021D9B377|nr:MULTISPECIES: hypothetical protein [unclassified Shewanella]MCU7965034.1 hypothetical protein [Shewanella sp. SW32]MCU7973022.1 hypothetical protein [Shewanella sp. SW29]MDT3273396.1 hypothetical protein [Shewanella sp. SP2S2-4]
MKRIILFLIVIAFSFSANALKVDTMFLLSDTKGNGVVTVTNDLPKTSFIKTSIFEITTDNAGEVIRTEYTKQNIQSWQIMTTSPKLILEPSRVKDVGIRSLCHKVKCDKTKDRTFSIVFEPSPYLKKGEEQENAVQVNYGYSVIYVVPAEKSDMQYSIKRNGSVIEIFNKGNTMLTFVIDRCSMDKTMDCRVQERVIAGRFRTFNIPEYMKAIKVNASIYNHDESYKREIALEPESQL